MKHSHKKSMQRIFQAGLLTSAGAATLLLSGCASIMHGTTQDIGISSTPTGAQVAVDNKPLGNTPVVGKLSRKENHGTRARRSARSPAPSRS